MFLLGGMFFLSQAILKFMEGGISGSYEFFLLGSIMFIPGSYHSFLAFQAFRGVEGFSFDEVAIFDEDFNKREDD